jgi:hypothetical protein
LFSCYFAPKIGKKKAHKTFILPKIGQIGQNDDCLAAILRQKLAKRK